MIRKQQDAVGNIREILNNFDDRLHSDRVVHAINKPDCNCIYNKVACGLWDNWIYQGRGFYPLNKEGEKNFLKEMKEKGLNGKMIAPFLRRYNEQVRDLDSFFKFFYVHPSVK